MELIGMSDKVIHYKYDVNEPLEYQDIERLESIINYANFLKMKLELWMFIPCVKNINNEWHILEHPDSIKFPNGKSKRGYLKQYQEAKDRVIFEGFEFKLDNFVDGFCGWLMRGKDHSIAVLTNDKLIVFEIEEDFNCFIIEDLTSLGLTITTQAIKKYNLT